MKKITKKIYVYFELLDKKYKELFNTRLKCVIQFFPSNLYLLILSALLLILITLGILNNKDCVYSTDNGVKVPDEIVNESIYQKINTDKVSIIKDLGIRLSTFARKNKSNYEIIVYENDKIIYKEKINAANLKDNEYKLFRVNKKVKKNSIYKFEVKPINVTYGNGITITKDKNDNYNYRLYDKLDNYNVKIVLYAICLALFMFINYLINNRKIKFNKKLKELDNNYKKLFKTRLKCILQFFPSNVYLLGLFILLTVVTTSNLLNNDRCIYSIDKTSIFTDEIVNESIYQKINTDNISKINVLGIRFSTSARINKSKYEVIIYENNKSIYKKKIDAFNLKDNEFKKFKINRKVKKNNNYKFEVKPIHATYGNGVIILKDENGNYNYRLYDKSIFYNETIILSIMFLLLFMFTNYLINNGKIKSEDSFYKLMLIYFISATIIFPPLFEPDSAYHFDRAYVVSQNNIVEFATKKRLFSKKIPSNISCLSYGNNGTIINEVNDRNKLYKCFNSKKLVKDNNQISMPNKIAFLIPGLGIKFSMLFTNSPLIIFYAGRLFNTMISFLIILYALKIAPKHKRILLTIVMIPVFIQQMCSYSYDSLLNSLCILVIAYLIKFFYNDKLEIKDLIIYFLSIMVIFKIKLPYVLVGLPIIFVDKEKFGKNRIQKGLYLFAIALFIAIAYFLPRLGGNLNVIGTSGGSKRGIALNRLFDLKYTCKLIYYTIVNNGILYLETFVGSLGWLISYLPRILIYSYLAFICFAVLSEKQNINIKSIYKILMILISLALICGIFLAMLLSWTPINSQTIEGVQGRYLYAPILGLMLCLIPKNNKLNISDDTFYLFFNMSCLIYLLAILYLFY